jgi:hypothetical protein
MKARASPDLRHVAGWCPYATMFNAFDIAREMARQHAAGKSVEEAVAAVRVAFPQMTSTEFKQACRVGRDQMEMWQKTVGEDVAPIFDMIARGEPDADIKAALKRARLKGEVAFPWKRDDRS